MSLLMDALKKADAAKQEADAQSSENTPLIDENADVASQVDWDDQLLPEFKLYEEEPVLVSEEDLPEKQESDVNWDEQFLPEFSSIEAQTAESDEIHPQQVNIVTGSSEVIKSSDITGSSPLETIKFAENAMLETQSIEENIQTALPESDDKVTLSETKSEEVEGVQAPEEITIAENNPPVENINDAKKEVPISASAIKSLPEPTDTNLSFTEKPWEREKYTQPDPIVISTTPETAQRVIAAGEDNKKRRSGMLYFVLLLVLVGLGIGYYYLEQLTTTQPTQLIRRPTMPTSPTKVSYSPPTMRVQNDTSTPSTPTVANNNTSVTGIKVSEASTMEAITTRITSENITKSTTVQPETHQIVNQPLMGAMPAVKIAETSSKQNIQVIVPVKASPKLTEKPMTSVTSLSSVFSKPSHPSVPDTNSYDQQKTVKKTAIITNTPGIHALKKTEKQTINTHLSKAYQAFQHGNNQSAQNAYQKALAQNKNNRDALLGLAAIAMRRGQPERALQHYQKILRIYPQDTLAQAGIIGALGVHAPRDSESRLKLLLETSPNAPYLHFSLGNVYAQQRRWASAQQAYFNAYHHDRQQQADYAYNLAISLDHLNKPAQALTYYQQALKQSHTQKNYSFKRQQVQKRIQSLSKHAKKSALSSLGM